MQKTSPRPVCEVPARFCSDLKIEKPQSGEHSKSLPVLRSSKLEHLDLRGNEPDLPLKAHRRPRVYRGCESPSSLRACMVSWIGLMHRFFISIRTFALSTRFIQEPCCFDSTLTSPRRKRGERQTKRETTRARVSQRAIERERERERERGTK